ncbi:DUF6382 domain-containing protein [Paenibacillus sp. SI8]|uniref:DUF6382 domain-containing protein n=1 Tax=unclassified Paenibacillus TaxID=185978 RepID=UPI003465B5A0
MVQEIWGLRYDFVYRHGHYMELYKDEGIAHEALCNLQLRMLEANQVPNLLPLEVLEVDFRISLLYNLSAKRMLAHVIKAEGISGQQLAKLLYAIVCALDESKNYMLNASRYVLKEHFIFIGNDWSDVFLTYLPLDEHEEKDSVFTSLQVLVTQLMTKVRNEDQTIVAGWQVSLAQLTDMQAYKLKLLSLMDNNEAISVRTRTVEQQRLMEKGEEESMQSVHSQPLGLPRPIWNKNEVALQKENFQERIPKKTSSTFKKISLRNQMITLAIVILLTAFLWQNYLTYPSMASFQLTSGLTVLLCDVWMMIKFIGLPLFKKEECLTNTLQPDEGLILERINTTDQPTSQPENIQLHYQNLHLHTTLLRSPNPNATVLLGRMAKRTRGTRLEWMKDGVMQTYTVESSSFTMGRGDSNMRVDCAIDEEGISRLHAEICQEGEEFWLKDLGSTNGTYLNGEQLVAYQAYGLKDGDTLRIVRTDFTFRL